MRARYAMSSVGYAARLNQDADVGGTLGEPEIWDAEDKVERDALALALIIKESVSSSTHTARHGCVIHTGAGISRACGIPDFRGPDGVWTRKARGLPPPECSIALDRAAPSATHQIIAALVRRGYVRQVVSCNVDCLHIKSGLASDKLCELHGNCFAERCETCGKEYVRDFEQLTVGFQLTGRHCVDGACGGRLRDQVLDWDDALPEVELKRAERESTHAYASIVLGSSLQIKPACDIPLRTTHLKRRRGVDDKYRGKLVIVNLQATVKDKKASLVIHAESDRVMRRVAQHLRLRIPEYIRVDRLRVKYEPSVASFAIRVVNIDDEDAPIPWLDRIDLRFSSPQDDVLLSSETVALKSPFVHHMQQLQLPVTDALLVVHMTFHFAEGCTERPVSKRHSMSLVKTEEVRYEFTTIVKRYEQENEEDDGQVSC